MRVSRSPTSACRSDYEPRGPDRCRTTSGSRRGSRSPKSLFESLPAPSRALAGRRPSHKPAPRRTASSSRTLLFAPRKRGETSVWDYGEPSGKLSTKTDLPYLIGFRLLAMVFIDGFDE